MKKYKVGYTQGVFDMFHIGHLNLLNKAKEKCDFLIVGVNSDALVQQYKNKSPIIPEEERRSIVENIKAVDRCVIASSLDKCVSWEAYQYDVLFIGDDWKGNSRWSETEQIMKQHNVDVIYLPHTEGISSTELRMKVENRMKEEYHG